MAFTGFLTMVTLLGLCAVAALVRAKLLALLTAACRHVGESLHCAALHDMEVTTDLMKHVSYVEI